MHGILIHCGDCSGKQVNMISPYVTEESRSCMDCHPQ